jgi:DNA-3-methyladenine glycosylase I
VRNRLKVAASIANARATLELYEQGGSLDALLWSFVDGRPKQNRWRSMSEIPALTPEAEKLSKELKRRGFGFIGPTVMYAHMQATGMVNDHLVSCPRHAALRS